MEDYNRKRFLYRAHEQNMTTSDYVYLYYWLLPDDEVARPWASDDYTPEEDHMKAAFYALKQVLVSFP